MCSTGAVGFTMSLQFMSTEGKAHLTAQQTPEEFLPILEQYEELFKEPTTLPPSRDYDHSIPLKEDASPPNV